MRAKPTLKPIESLQENVSDFYPVDNRDAEEQEQQFQQRRSRASSPVRTSSNGANSGKQYVVYSSHPAGCEADDALYDDDGSGGGGGSDSGGTVKMNLNRATNFAELSKLRDSFSSSAINIVYMQQDKDSPHGIKKKKKI